MKIKMIQGEQKGYKENEVKNKENIMTTRGIQVNKRNTRRIQGKQWEYNKNKGYIRRTKRIQGEIQ